MDRARSVIFCDQLFVVSILFCQALFEQHFSGPIFGGGIFFGSTQLLCPGLSAALILAVGSLLALAATLYLR